LTRALIVTVVVILIIAMFQGTTWALRLKASREDEVAARAAGIGVLRERSLAWVLSAFLAGAGGALYAGYVGTFNPDTFYLDPTFVVLSMLIVGGFRSLTGAVIGAAFISIVVQIFTQMEEGVHLGPIHFTAPSGLEQVGLSIITLLVLLLRQDGLVGDRELVFPRSRSRRPRRGIAASPTPTPGPGSGHDPNPEDTTTISRVRGVS
jgi:branched-chain amino acid transport system permease protein